ncbi:hypothetical protein CcCBS67573_g09035 [Chytriomyces confervae]|uniref:RING-type domain-containing protein n=1 Tax=Chytriomyces confervae TaxID=246404 RepID=A0A507E8L9_9FUNG|nr:hypothetical protein CcCBS67573_g09035 [Chytriomyces confervae]
MDDSTLKSLRICTKKNDLLQLMPVFSKSVKEYTLCVGSDIDGVVVSASPSEGDAFVQVQKSAANGVVGIQEGASDIIIKCDAADGSSSNTVIHVFRPSANDATLKAVQFSYGVIEPDFHRLETAYILRIVYLGYAAPTVSEVTVTATPTNATAKVVSHGTGPNGSIKLAGNETEVSFEVASADGTLKQTYSLLLRKGKVGSRLVLTKDCKINASHTCSICCCILYLPRSKPPASKCTHEFCLTCFELFGAALKDSKKLEMLCFLCGDGCGQVLARTDGEKDAALSTMKYGCPFAVNGCTASAIEAPLVLRHVMECVTGKPVDECSECSEIGAGMHKDACVFQCELCAKRVPAWTKSLHESLTCLSKRKPVDAVLLAEPAGWEQALADKKALPATAEGCVKAVEPLLKQYLTSLSAAWRSSEDTFGANPSQPDVASLAQMAKLYGTAISINIETRKVKGGVLDDSLHVELGLVMEEMESCEAMFPAVETRAAKVKVNDNAKASDSFMSDEVDGLLMGLGVAKTASDASKLKAMEEEFHRLTAAGLSDQAAEVQGLHQWKVKKVNAGSSVASTDNSNSHQQQQRGSGRLSKALSKYEDAVSINPGNSDALYNSGRVNLILGHFERAQLCFEQAIAARPVFKNALFLFAVAVLLQSNPASSLLPFSVNVIERQLLQFQTNLWLDIKETKQEHSSKLCDTIMHLSSPLLRASFLALSRGYMFSGGFSKASKPALDLLYLLPNAMRKLPKKSHVWRSMATTLCEARQLLVQLSALCAPVDPILALLDKGNCESLLRMVLSVAESQGGGEWFGVVENVCRVLVYRAPMDSLALTMLGKAQLDLVDNDARFLGDQKKLQDAIECFEAALGVGEGNGVKLVEKQDWFVRMKEEVGCWEAAAKPKDVKVAGLKAGAKKTAILPVKAVPAAKAVPPAKSVLPSKPAPSKPAPPVKATQKATATDKNGATPAPKTQGATKTISKKTSAVTSKNTTPKASNVSLSKTKSPSTTLKQITLPMFETSIGLARAISRKVGFIEDKSGPKDPRIPPLVETITTHYNHAIKSKPGAHDAYIELGALLERKVSIRAAADIYASFPFREFRSGGADPGQDDLYLYTELGRCFMKEKRYKEVLLVDCLVAEGRAMGMPCLAKYVEALDAAGESKLLMQVYAGVSKKPVDHPDLQAFFKSRYWA